MTISEKPKCIVMPMQPASGQRYDGVGLGLHFLLGNVMAVHPLLNEFWFGWRVNRIFTDQDQFTRYCRGEIGFHEIEKSEGIQDIAFRLSGVYERKEDHLAVSLTLSVFKQPEKNQIQSFVIDLSDGLIDFRRSFNTWFETCDLPFTDPQVRKTLWPERICLKGLDYLGRSMAATYMNYLDPAEKKIDLDYFEKTVKKAPDSYLAWDMKGWGLYKNQSYEPAEKAFLKALSINQNGLGALAGLMWCHIFTRNRKQALKYALAKADVRQDSREKASAFIKTKFFAV